MGMRQTTATLSAGHPRSPPTSARHKVPAHVPRFLMVPSALALTLDRGSLALQCFTVDPLSRWLVRSGTDHARQDGEPSRAHTSASGRRRGGARMPTPRKPTRPTTEALDQFCAHFDDLLPRYEERTALRQ